MFGGTGGGESHACPPQDCIHGGQSWGGQFWVHWSSGLPTSITTLFFILFSYFKVAAIDSGWIGIEFTSNWSNHYLKVKFVSVWDSHQTKYSVIYKVTMDQRPNDDQRHQTTQMQPMWVYVFCKEVIWGNILKHILEKGHASAINVISCLLIWEVYGLIWKHTVEKS